MTASVCELSGQDGVVPVAVKRGGLKIEGGHLGIGHPDALRVGAAVEAALDGEAGAGGGAGDQLDNHLVGEQGLAAPVLGDEGEQPMLDPVPPDAVIRAQALGRTPMASLMLQYDRPTDHTRQWNDYNGRVRDWIARLLRTPGAVSFLAYRTADGASPNTITMLDFRTLEDARRAVTSDHLKAILGEIRSTGTDYPRVLVVERSPFTPEPLRP